MVSHGNKKQQKQESNQWTCQIRKSGEESRNEFLKINSDYKPHNTGPRPPQQLKARQERYQLSLIVTGKKEDRIKEKNVGKRKGANYIHTQLSVHSHQHHNQSINGYNKSIIEWI